MTASKASEPFDIREARQQIAEQRELWLAEREQVIKLMAERVAAEARAAEAERKVSERQKEIDDISMRTSLLTTAEVIVMYQDASRLYRQERAAREAAALDAGRLRELLQEARTEVYNKYVQNPELIARIDAALRRSAP